MQLRDGEHRRVVNLRCCAAERTVVRIEREGACENSTRAGVTRTHCHSGTGRARFTTVATSNAYTVYSGTTVDDRARALPNPAMIYHDVSNREASRTDSAVVPPRFV